MVYNTVSCNKNTCILNGFEMIFCVKNEYTPELGYSVTVPGMSLETAKKLTSDAMSRTDVTISLTSCLSKGFSFDLLNRLKSDLCMSVKAALSGAYRVIDEIASEFVAVVTALSHRVSGVLKRHVRVLDWHLNKKVLYGRQAVLSCAGGLRL